MSSQSYKRRILYYILYSGNTGHCQNADLSTYFIVNICNSWGYTHETKTGTYFHVFSVSTYKTIKILSNERVQK